MAELEEKIFSEIELKSNLWWRYIDAEEKFKEFIEHLSEKHPTIKFTEECSQTSINFFDVTVSLIGGNVSTDLPIYSVTYR